MEDSERCHIFPKVRHPHIWEAGTWDGLALLLEKWLKLLTDYQNYCLISVDGLMNQLFNFNFSRISNDFTSVHITALADHNTFISLKNKQVEEALHLHDIKILHYK